MLDPIALAEAFAGGRGKPQGCGLRARKAGCRAQAVRVMSKCPGSGILHTASAPNPVAFAGDY